MGLGIMRWGMDHVTVAGWIVQSENVTVTNGAKLTFNAGESVIINAPLTVNAGSQIELLIN